MVRFLLFSYFFLKMISFFPYFFHQKPLVSLHMSNLNLNSAEGIRPIKRFNFNHYPRKAPSFFVRNSYLYIFSSIFLCLPVKRTSSKNETVGSTAEQTQNKCFELTSNSVKSAMHLPFENVKHDFIMVCF